MKVVENLESEWREVSMEKAGRSPKAQVQEVLTTPSRYEALSNADENGIELVNDEIVGKEIEEEGFEEVEDLSQSRMEESVEEKLKENKRGRRQHLPRQSKINHKVVQGRGGSTKNL